jgi:flagellar export protein FliJ
MKLFRFRLQRYLDLNKEQEDAKRLKLHRVQLVYKEESAKLGLIDSKIEGVVDYTKTARQKQLNIEMMQLAESYHHSLLEQRAMQASIVENALQQVTEEQKMLISIQRRRKMLERLKGKQWEAYYQGLLQEEQKELDELGRIRFCRQQG